PLRLSFPSGFGGVSANPECESRIRYQSVIDGHFPICLLFRRFRIGDTFVPITRVVKGPMKPLRKLLDCPRIAHAFLAPLACLFLLSIFLAPPTEAPQANFGIAQ